ncbi:MAG: sodium ion-translocating decarboxylase subunit beta [Kiritimatiellae bacterium]|nr:sodium ion-translocating decarboxylase subunit beta [Kiritimatiellia bacterium]
MKKIFLTCAAALILCVSQLAAQNTDIKPALDQSGAALITESAQAPANTGWRDTLNRVKNLAETTGIQGFFVKEAPAYITEGYYKPTGQRVEGHPVHIIGGLPYGAGQAVMILVCLGLIYLAIVKGFEPLLLLPIGFGGLLANMPYSNVVAPPVVEMLNGMPTVMEPGGYLYYFFDFGVETGLFPILIFMGVGAMTDFGPLIANPRTALLGAAAQFGIFLALFGALVLSEVSGGAINFGLKEAASIGIIGGADGPTAIWLTSKLAPQILGAVAVAAYSYMALVPIIQPPIMRALVPEKERGIVMNQLRHVSRMEKVCFPLIVLLLCALLLPSAVPLVGALMLGNLAREVGPSVARLSDTMSNELINIVTILLGLSVGSKLACEKFMTGETLGILGLGLVAFAIGTAAGCLMGRLMNKFSKAPINPLIGAAGVSAVPMAARVANKVGLESNPTNFLLMHAMGPNVAGVIGSAVVAGVLYTLCK